jgi:hypothetical protein
MIEYQYADTAEHEGILSPNADELDAGGNQSRRCSLFRLVMIFWLIPSCFGRTKADILCCAKVDDYAAPARRKTLFKERLKWGF